MFFGILFLNGGVPGMKNYFKQLIIICSMLGFFNTPTHASSYLTSSLTMASLSPFLSVLRSGEEIIARLQAYEIQKQCLAIALYHEARGEPVDGQYAVGVTILNRVRSSAYPNTVCGVVYQNAHKKNRCQFSFACDDISDKPKNRDLFRKIQNLAAITMNGNFYKQHKNSNPAFFATLADMTHYHRYDITPVWSKKLHRLHKIGNHLFLKSSRVTKRYTANADFMPEISEPKTSAKAQIYKVHLQG